jgi:hypothetical protein
MITRSSSFVRTICWYSLMKTLKKYSHLQGWEGKCYRKWMKELVRGHGRLRVTGEEVHAGLAWALKGVIRCWENLAWCPVHGIEQVLKACGVIRSQNGNRAKQGGRQQYSDWRWEGTKEALDLLYCLTAGKAYKERGAPNVQYIDKNAGHKPLIRVPAVAATPCSGGIDLMFGSHRIRVGLIFWPALP